MRNLKVKRKLESIRELPTVPTVISQVLHAVDDADVAAARLAGMIEKDQTLTARVLRVANSPFYGFARKISTIDLAVVVLGLNTIKEIVLSLIVQKFFSRVTQKTFDVAGFWQYSVFCGAGSRLLARKLGYRLAGEAFVGGLMHDVGALVLIEYFTSEFNEIRELQNFKNISMVEAERDVLDTDHCEIGAWLAQKWNLPEQLCRAIRFHHSGFAEAKAATDESGETPSGAPHNELFQTLTAIVAMSEWFAIESGFKDWSGEPVIPELYLANEILSDLSQHDVLNPESALEVIKRDIMDEYEKAAAFIELPTKDLY